MRITAERVRSLLHYDKATGRLFWRTSGPGKRKGARAGGANKILGYWLIGLDGDRYYAHDLAWLHVYGEWPRRIEFINGNGMDTSLHNIREKTRLTRSLQSKPCAVCGVPFNRDGRLSHSQWASQKNCSKTCTQEQKRKAAFSTTCRECGKEGRPYITSSGRRSRGRLCKACFNILRNPKRKAKHRVDLVERPEKYLYQRMKTNARQRGAMFCMTYDEFLAEIGGRIPSVCPVLGIPLSVMAPYNSDQLATIDRIDSSRSYERGNIAIISWRANAIKRNGTADEHRRIAAWMEGMGAA